LFREDYNPPVLKTLVRRTLLAAAGIVALAVVANAFDEAIHPEVAAYLDERPRAPAEQRNGYFQAVGLAALEAEPHAAGRAHVAGIAAAQAKRLEGGEASWPQLPMLSIPPVLRGAEGLCAMDSGAPCVAEVGAHRREAAALVDEHALLLQRYRRLLEYPEYLETHRIAHYETPYPAFLPLTAAQSLFHVQSALGLAQGRALHVAYDLERSIRFSRRMLAGSTTMLGKMVASAHARRAALFASESLPAIARADRAALGRLARALAPLSPGERSLAEAHRSELAKFTSVLGICDQPAGLWGVVNCHFFQPNATLNRKYFALQKPLLAPDASPAREAALPWWSLAYNPVGKVLIHSDAGVGPWDYIARVHDLDALLRAVALQATVGARGLKGPELAAFLDKSGVDWDPGRREIFFEPRAGSRMKTLGTARRFSVDF
jgi:hypothetical protein